MSSRGGRKRRGAAVEHDNEERWLLTYADMIPLLMALFMVMFSIANVNKAKLESLSQSLQEAFSGKILPGGKSIQQNGASEKTNTPSPTPPIPAIMPLVSDASRQESQTQARQEQDDFKRIKHDIDQYARTHGLSAKLQSPITQ